MPRAKGLRGPVERLLQARRRRRFRGRHRRHLPRAEQGPRHEANARAAGVRSRHRRDATARHWIRAHQPGLRLRHLLLLDPRQGLRSRNGIIHRALFLVLSHDSHEDGTEQHIRRTTPRALPRVPRRAADVG